MDKKIVIFDMDGVLIDSIDIMIKLIQDRFSGAVRKDMEELFTGNFMEKLQEMKTTYAETLVSAEEYQHLGEEYTKEKTETVELYLGIKELLCALRTNNFSLSINTSASDDNTFSLLKRLGVYDYFDHIITRDFTKSKVDKFVHLADLYNCSPKDFIFVTDSLGDVLEAAELGVPTIAVTWGVHGRHYFENQNLIAVVDGVEDLQKKLIEKPAE